MTTFGEQLALVREWFTALGGKVTDVPLDVTIGRDLPSLAIDLGQVRLNAVEDRACGVSILMSFQFAQEVRDAVNRLNIDNQRKVLLLLKTTLMENPRLAWSLEPSTCTAIGEVTKITLHERMRIDAEDLATYNRFQDALQELMTAQVKILVLFETTVGAGPTGPTLPERKHPESGMAYR